jgi:L-lactate dehydrogenase complex protein LldE
MSSGASPKVALFATCLVDLFRPSVGFAAVKLLENAGCTVDYPVQTCCGQPAFNGGDRKNAIALARQAVKALAEFEYIVAPSGSCAGMIRRHYPDLLKDDPLGEQAKAVAERTYELTAFLVDVLGVDSVPEKYSGNVAYHDSCACLRDFGIKDQPRKLMASIDGLNLKDIPEPEECCGFGGTFAVKYGDISAEIAGKKTANVKSTGAKTLVAADLGCLFNLAGRLKREGSDIEVRHIAEILAGDVDGPAIGDPED